MEMARGSIHDAWLGCRTMSGFGQGLLTLPRCHALGSMMAARDLRDQNREKRGQGQERSETMGSDCQCHGLFERVDKGLWLSLCAKNSTIVVTFQF